MVALQHQLFDRYGHQLFLSSLVGKGGEGAVHEIRGTDDAVAKIYYVPVDAERARKLTTMADLCNERLLRLAAWPIDTLHDQPGGRIVGFMMQRIRNHKGIHVLYSPKTRLSDFPSARWPFLVHTATNLARAFAVIQEHGHVIGDVNHGNVVVSRDATVKLIDCDSFQISTEQHIFTCEVGVSTHTPPELQGMPLKDIVRTTNHDNFGLAVLIFQLLFMGRHPFSGQFLGEGEMPLEKAISEYRFAYGDDTVARLMNQPPGTLSLGAVSPEVSDLFRRAFLQERDRPGAAEWITALTELSENLAPCFYSKSHAYLKQLRRCPWCELEVQSGTLLFNPSWVATSTNGDGFNLPVLWKQISSASLPKPRPLPAHTTYTTVLTSSDPAIVSWKFNLVYLMLPSILVLFAAILIAFFSTPTDYGLGILVLAGTIAVGLTHRMSNDFLLEINEAKEEIEPQWEGIKNNWGHNSERQQFEATKWQLEAKKKQYLDLSRLRQEKVQRLVTDFRNKKLDEHLSNFRIAEADIEISEDCRRTLGKFGVEDASDLDSYVILSMGGIGKQSADTLIQWRKSLEDNFVMDPSNDISPAEVEIIDNEIISISASLQREIEAGRLSLRRISDQIKNFPPRFDTEVNKVLARMAQFELDSRIGAGSNAPMALTIISIIIALIIVVSSK